MRKLALFLLFFSVSLAGNSLLLSGNVPAGSFINSPGNFQILLAEKSIQAEAALFIGSDGTAAFINENALSHINISPSDSLWESASDLLPPVCSIKDLEEVCLFRSLWPVKFRLSNSKNDFLYSPYLWRISQFNQVGESQKNGFSALKFTIKNSDLLPAENTQVIIKFADGELLETPFSRKDFRFDGWRFYYSNKEVSELSCSE